MKVVAFNGSPRKAGNTSQLIQAVFEELAKEGIETELIEMAGCQLRGCTACYQCKENKNMQCVIKGDKLNEYVQKMVEADGIILASPTYFCNVTAEMKALIDRAGLVTRANDSALKRKVGAAVVAVRRAGAITTFDAMNHFFLINQMIVAGSNYWNLGIGGPVGSVNEDEEGIETMHTLGRNMAWIMSHIY